MTTKEKIIRAAIAKAKKEIEEIKAIVYANPLGRICELRIEAQKIVNQYGEDNSAILRLIRPLGEEEKRMFALAEKQKKSGSLIKRQVDLEFELDELGQDLYEVERKSGMGARRLARL